MHSLTYEFLGTNASVVRIFFQITIDSSNNAMNSVVGGVFEYLKIMYTAHAFVPKYADNEEFIIIQRSFDGIRNDIFKEERRF